MKVWVRRAKRSGACWGSFLQRSATLTVQVIICYKSLFYGVHACHDFTATSLSFIFTINLYWELWSVMSALDEAAYHNKNAKRADKFFSWPRAHAIQTPCAVRALNQKGKKKKKSGGGVSTFIIAIVLWCAACSAPVWASRYHCGTVQWVMGIANHWQSEFPSQPYTRRQLWRSTRIYSSPLSTAGCPRSFLSSYPESALWRFRFLRGRRGRIKRHLKHLTQFIVSNGKPSPTTHCHCLGGPAVWQRKSLSNSSRGAKKKT